jgi:probable addiction module antidote protein
MSTAITKPFDPAEYLDDSESFAACLTDALEREDQALVADALGVAARARGMSEVVRKAGVSRESLDRALSADGNPEFATILRAMQALGRRLSAAPLPKRKSAGTPGTPALASETWVPRCPLGQVVVRGVSSCAAWDTLSH